MINSLIKLVVPYRVVATLHHQNLVRATYTIIVLVTKAIKTLTATVMVIYFINSSIFNLQMVPG